MNNIVIAIGLSESQCILNEAVIFPENIKMMYALDSSKEMYELNRTKFRKYKNIKIFNQCISDDPSEGIKLKDFILEHNISRIDNIIINTDGNELEILKTLEDNINLVEHGSIKCRPKENPKFPNQASYDDSMAFLQSQNFNVHSLSNIPEGEWTLFFSRITNENIELT